MRSDRLEAIASFVPKGSIVADVGTDHGYLPLFLVEENIATRVIASDVSAPSLAKLEAKIQNDMAIKTVVSDGLSHLKPNEAEVLTISGMGGVLIAELMDAHPQTTSAFQRMILAPNNASEAVRQKIHDFGFSIVDESLIKDGKHYYEIIVADPGEEFYRSDWEYQYGKILIDRGDIVLVEKLNRKCNVLIQVLSHLGFENSSKAQNRIYQIKKEIEDTEDLIRLCKYNHS